MVQGRDASLAGAHDESRESAYESGATLALCVVALAAFYLHSHSLARLPVDDAGISVAYARTLVEGHGLRVTHESPVTEGYSNPSWTLILIVLEALGADSLTFVKPLGVFFAALALPVIMFWGPIAESRRLRLEDALAPWIAALHPSFVYWAQGGLEMGLQVLGIASLTALGLGAPSPRRGLLFGAAAAWVALTRPEGPLYVLAAGSGWLFRLLRERRRLGRADLNAALAGALPVLVYLAFRLRYFGEWLPNTYFAKNAWDFGATVYLAGFFAAYRPLCIACVCALPLACLGARGTRLRGLCNMLVLAALGYFAYHAKGDWMMEWRFLAPLAPFQGAALAAGISGARQALARAAQGPLFCGPGMKVPTRIQRTLLMLGLLLTFWTAYKLLSTEFERSEPVRRAGWDVSITIAKGTPFEPASRILAPFKMAHPLLIASDMGAISLGMRHAELWDFAGLTDPAVARHFDQLGTLEDYLAHEGPPTLALAWGPGTFFHSLPLVAARYTRVAPGYYLLRGLTPNQDPRCPGGKQRVLALGPKRLYAVIADELRANEPLRALARWRCAHSYLADRALPDLPARSALARLSRAHAESAMGRARPELALRFYSLCAVIGLHDTRLSVACRKRAEPIRSALFDRTAPPAPAAPVAPAAAAQERLPSRARP
jgi:hypothetical protein